VCERVEGFGFLFEVVNVKDCFSIWEIQSCEICVKASLWRSEVWYAGAGTDACADHDCDCARLSSADVFCDAIEVPGGEDCGRYRFVDRAAFVLTHCEEVAGSVSCPSWFMLEISFHLPMLLILLVFATYGGEGRTQSVKEAEDCSYVTVTPGKQDFLCSLLAYHTYHTYRCADGMISELSHRWSLERHG
jgi:hypothetical protein